MKNRGENILKQPMKIVIVKLQRKTHKKKPKEEEEMKQKRQIFTQVIKNENQKYETKIVSK